MRVALRRRTVALVTAYVLALQALLPALALAVGTNGDGLRTAAEVCTTAAAFDGGIPSGRQDGCSHGLACLTAGCAGIAAAVPSVALQFGPEFSRSVPTLRPIERAPWRLGLPHHARAPPDA